MSMPRPDALGRRARSAAALLLAGSLVACSIPFPVVVAGGPFVVPPSVAKDPLSSRGAEVQVVAAAPPGCLFLGLATGVGGAPSQSEGIGDGYLRAYQAEAVIALRNSVGEIGGTHTIVAAEVQHSGREGLTAVVLRGPALRCR